jgi:hypothetical protein
MMLESMHGAAGTGTTLSQGLHAIVHGGHGALTALGAFGQGIAQTLASRMHDVSVAALAAAVATLGAVMLLELRTLARLRSSVDRNLARVFEQLDLLRLDQAELRDLPEPHSVQARLRDNPEKLRESLAADVREQLHRLLHESRLPRSGSSEQDAIAPVANSGGIDGRSDAWIATLAPADRDPLAAGEARLIASLAEARARRAAAARAQ